MTIKIEMLRAFSTVAQTGNLAEAAQRLGRTPSAVSMVLKSLEEHLGQRLFESDRKSQLSPLGVQVLELAQEELKQFDSTIRSIETFAQAQHGLIRAAAVPSVAALVFPKVLSMFKKQFPLVQVELRDGDSASVARAVTRGQVDVGIASIAHRIRDAEQSLLFSDPFGLICARDHTLATRTAEPDPQQIVDAGFINNELCHHLPEPITNFLAQKTPALAQNTLTLMSMVRSGSWVTILPKRVADIDPSGLAFRRIKGVSTKRDVHLFIRQRPTPPDYVRVFSDLIKAQEKDFLDTQR